MKQNLGNLRKISLREAWKNEATDFTPWLAEQENLNSLADTLGLGELELVQREYPIGDFSLDILCTDDQGEVIIENQLEKTDHTHLGQIITYASGVGAKKIIWIAESFRREHVAALEFLNQNTTEDLNFFAVEIELWQIGDSPMAPSFNVVVKPNGWAKAGREQARAVSSATPLKLLQLKFWTDLVAYIDQHKINLGTTEPKPQHWFNNRLGKSGFVLSFTANSRASRLGVELYIDPADSKEKFRALESRKMEIEGALGCELDWQLLPDSHACRIALFKPDFELEDELQWPSYFEWLTKNGIKFQDVFKPIIRTI